MWAFFSFLLLLLSLDALIRDEKLFLLKKLFFPFYNLSIVCTKKSCQKNLISILTTCFQLQYEQLVFSYVFLAAYFRCNKNRIFHNITIVIKFFVHQIDGVFYVTDKFWIVYFLLNKLKIEMMNSYVLSCSDFTLN